MRANFFVMYPVSHLDNVPATYMSAFQAPASAGFDNALVRQFPNVTSVDLTTTIAQVQRILDQVIGAVEFLFGFTLAAGLVVLFAAVTATLLKNVRANLPSCGQSVRKGVCCARCSVPSWPVWGC